MTLEVIYIVLTGINEGPWYAILFWTKYIDAFTQLSSSMNNLITAPKCFSVELPLCKVNVDGAAFKDFYTVSFSVQVCLSVP